LHFAPESGVAEILRPASGTYETADLMAPKVDYHVDVTDLPFAAASYDLVFASHVLEHVKDDHLALSEISRILAPGGLAILPVPVVQATTREYNAPNPSEFYHVRAPGIDYYERYRRFFSRVEILSSNNLPVEIQPFVFENRSNWPNKRFPDRTPSLGAFHLDYLPLCWA
jgi:SAM-dependent methyltransferase